MKWIGFILLAMVPWVSAQTAPPYYFQDRSQKPADMLKKKSSFEGKMFSPTTFETKTYDTKKEAAPFDAKPIPHKEFATHTNSIQGQTHATTTFQQPPGDQRSWWQKLFSTKTADTSGKSYATTNFKKAENARIVQKIDQRDISKQMELPTIKPTPEELNRLK